VQDIKVSSRKKEVWATAHLEERLGVKLVLSNARSIGKLFSQGGLLLCVDLMRVSEVSGHASPVARGSPRCTHHIPSKVQTVDEPPALRLVVRLKSNLKKRCLNLQKSLPELFPDGSGGDG
jgi:hypothetical protein